jgi:hypothetical protein
MSGRFQGSALDEDTDTYQLRTLIPQKDTYSINAENNVKTRRVIVTNQEADQGNDHNPNASNIRENEIA